MSVHPLIVTLFTPDPPYPTRIVGPQNDTGSERSGGLHLSTVLRDIAATIGKSKDSATDDQLNWYASGGWLWEHIWDMAHAKAIEDGTMTNPGEFSCDGITGTPDRIDWTRPAVIELKCRWQSIRMFDSLEKNYWQELMQIKSYCWMTGIHEADLIIFYVAGDWRPPVPGVRAANLQFSERELRESWEQVIGHARKRGWLQ